MIHYTIMDSPIGNLLLAESEKGLSHIIFKNKLRQFKAIISKKFPDQPIKRDDQKLDHVVNQLFDYFAGNRNYFALDLDLVMPPFQMKALNVVKKIPYGSYLTYKEVARLAGNCNAVRATGSANANNPLPIVIPCHRVVATGGGLGGYGGGLKMKSFLLNFERDNVAIN